MSNENQLPEGAVPVDAPVPVAQSVGVAVGEAPVPVFKGRQAIKVELPDGRLVGMDVPKAALSQYVSRIMKDLEFKDPMMMLQEKMLVRALLYITDIDGVDVDKPMDDLARYKLEQELGVDGVDLVVMAYMQEFPPVEDKQLVIIKKS